MNIKARITPFLMPFRLLPKMNNVVFVRCEVFGKSIGALLRDPRNYFDQTKISQLQLAKL